MNIYKSPEGKKAILDLYQEIFSGWPVEHKQHLIDTSFGKTHVIECGDPDKPAVMFLHGSMSNALMWQPEVNLFTENFRVLVVDILGEPGLSDETRLDANTDEHARWINELLQALSVNKVALVGISFGGWLAIDFAYRFPEKVSALVTMCPAGVGKQKQSFIFKALFYSLLGKKGSQKLVDELTGEMDDQTKAFAESVRPVYRIFDDVRKNFRPRIVKFPTFSDQQLQKLGMPFFLIIGGSDVFFDYSNTSERIQSLLPRTKVDYVAGRGHLIMNQGKRIKEYLKRTV